MGCLIMKDVNDTKGKMFRFKWGGPMCEFFKYPEGVIKKGHVLRNPKRNLRRPESLKAV